MAWYEHRDENADFKNLVYPIATYGYEAWTINAGIRQRIEAFKSRCYRELQNAANTQHKTNDSIRQEFHDPQVLLNKFSFASFNCIPALKLVFILNFSTQGCNSELKSALQLAMERLNNNISY